MFFDDGFYEAFPVFAAAVGAVDVLAVTGDDVIVLYGFCDIGGWIFRNEFFVLGAAEIAGIAGAFEPAIGEFVILIAEAIAGRAVKGL
jgi:hypothetical protein